MPKFLPHRRNPTAFSVLLVVRSQEDSPQGTESTAGFGFRFAYLRSLRNLRFDLPFE